MSRAADDVTATLAAGIAELTEILAPIMESVSGYKAKCEEAGFSPTTAEMMAREFHSMLLAMVRANLPGVAR